MMKSGKINKKQEKAYFSLAVALILLSVLINIISNEPIIQSSLIKTDEQISFPSNEDSGKEIINGLNLITGFFDKQFYKNKKENSWVHINQVNAMRDYEPVPTRLENVRQNNYINVTVDNGEAEVAESGNALDLRSSSYKGTWVQNGIMKIPVSALNLNYEFLTKIKNAFLSLSFSDNLITGYVAEEIYDFSTPIGDGQVDKDEEGSLIGEENETSEPTVPIPPSVPIPGSNESTGSDTSSTTTNEFNIIPEPNESTGSDTSSTTMPSSANASLEEGLIERFLQKGEAKQTTSKITDTSTLSVKNSKDSWVVTKSTGNEAFFKAIFANIQDKKTDICYVLKDGVNAVGVDLTDKQLYDRSNNLILNDKNKPITLKYETAKCNDNGAAKDGYHISLTAAASINIDDFIQLGNSSLITEYQNIKLINYQSDWFDLNIGLFVNLSNKWEDAENNTWIVNNKFGADYNATNQTTFFLYQLNSSQPFLEKSPGGKSYTYYLEKIETNSQGGIFTQQHKLDFGDICAVELNLNASDDVIDSFNPRCDFKVYNILNKEYLLNVTFYANYDSIKGIIDIDPTISVDTTSGVAGIKTNVTSDGNFHHLTVNDSSLVLYMPFDTNTSVTTVYDYSSNNNDGAISEGAFWNNSGYFGGAFVFNGSSYLEISSLNTMNYKPITYTAWVRPNALPPNCNDVALTIIGRERAGSVVQGAIVLYCGSGTINQFIYYTGVSGVLSNFTPTIGLMYHLAFTMNSSNTTRWYINGTQTNVSVYNIGSSLNAEFRIGASSGNRFYFNGTIDEVMIFNRSLSAQEIADLYNNQSSRFYTQGYLDMQNLSLGGNNESLMNITLNATGLYQNANLTVQTGFQTATGYSYNGTIANLSLVTINDNYISQLKTEHYNLTGSPSNMSIRIGFWAGNSSFLGYNPFYSPVLIGNFTITTYQFVTTTTSSTSSSSSTLPRANLTLYLRNSTAQATFTGLYTNITILTNESFNITSKEPYPGDVNFTLFVTDYAGVNQSRNISKSFLQNFTTFWTTGNFLINVSWEGNLTLQPNSTAFYVTVLATTTTSSSTTSTTVESDTSGITGGGSRTGSALKAIRFTAELPLIWQPSNITNIFIKIYDQNNAPYSPINVTSIITPNYNFKKVSLVEYTMGNFTLKYKTEDSPFGNYSLLLIVEDLNNTYNFQILEGREITIWDKIKTNINLWFFGVIIFLFMVIVVILQFIWSKVKQKRGIG